MPVPLLETLMAIPYSPAPLGVCAKYWLSLLFIDVAVPGLDDPVGPLGGLVRCVCPCWLLLLLLGGACPGTT